MADKPCCEPVAMNDCCNGATVLIYPCSGSSDVGEISDHAGRLLTKEGFGKMHCLAGIGGRVPGITLSAQAADKILAIDGCPQDCASKTLFVAGIDGFASVRVTDHGMPKGKTPVTDSNVRTIVQRGAEALRASELRASA
ncbi:MAG: DGC domain protein [Candidatus Latescibacteria bacterium ADurb.Bin168]|nr:MAG: DGC domain protein [Candidatus Latescibacteria bacterium ADurb.Bin168]